MSLSVRRRVPPVKAHASRRGSIRPLHLAMSVNLRISPPSKRGFQGRFQRPRWTLPTRGLPQAGAQPRGLATMKRARGGALGSLAWPGARRSDVRPADPDIPLHLLAGVLSYRPSALTVRPLLIYRSIRCDLVRNSWVVRLARGLLSACGASTGATLLQNSALGLCSGDLARGLSGRLM